MWTRILWSFLFLFCLGHGIGIRRRFINGPLISYNDYYNRYHGFRIVDSRFYYNGLGKLTVLFIKCNKY